MKKTTPKLTVADLETRIHELTLRAADSRDSIVKLRDRLHELREQRKYLVTKVEDLEEQLGLEELRRQTEVAALSRLHKETLRALWEVRADSIILNDRRE